MNQPDLRPSKRFYLTSLVSIAALTGLSVVLGGFSLQGARFAGFAADDAIYLLMAEYFSQPGTYDAVLIYTQAYSHLPPLYPLLIASLTGAADLVPQAFIVQTGCLILAASVWSILIGRETGQRYAVVPLLFALVLLPGTLLLTTAIWSEFLYMLLVGMAMLSLQLTAQRRIYIYAAGMLIGFSAVTRGFGLVAIIALALHFALKRQRGGFIVVCIAIAPYAASQLVGLGGGSYWEFFRERIFDMDTLAQTIEANVASLANGWIASFSPFHLAPGLLLNTLILPLSIIGFYERLRRFEFDAIYTVGYFSLLLIWPFPDVTWRLVYPAIPIAIFHAFVGVTVIRRHLRGNLMRYAPAAVLGALIATNVVGLIGLSVRYTDQALPAALDNWRASRSWLTASSVEKGIDDLAVRQATLELLTMAESTLPPKACIYANYPQPVMLYGRRASWPAPTGADRPTRPACEFHLVVSDKRAPGDIGSLWSDYDIVLQSKAGDGIGAVLVRYRQ